jgi:hypothetical protein
MNTILLFIAIFRQQDSGNGHFARIAAQERPHIDVSYGAKTPLDIPVGSRKCPYRQ